MTPKIHVPRRLVDEVLDYGYSPERWHFYASTPVGFANDNMVVESAHNSFMVQLRGDLAVRKGVDDKPQKKFHSLEEGVETLITKLLPHWAKKCSWDDAEVKGKEGHTT
eukprot:Hpha_TRINITY_DN16474_c1_g1::TRINITY_DN16474_c1_g1_i2::g.160320::m.160320